jgi:hypothetical protein|tara:strand:+ start:61 stop:681 length:621 start_codon:yes stop_codon:yes gene_type:complete
MALPTSGNLTLNQIHVEAGGTSETACTINDSDIRGLEAADGYTIPTGSGTAIEIGDFYGATDEIRTSLSGSAALSATLNAGYTSAFGFASMGYISGSIGSLSNTSWMGKTITALYSSNINYPILFTINAPVFNSGWTSLSLYHSYTNASNPYVMNRTDANYSYTSGSTTWSWNVSLPGSYSYDSQLIGYPRNTAWVGTQAQNFILA